jgi:hypothetical protein
MRSASHFFFRTTCCSHRRSSSIPSYPSDIYLIILGPRASSDYLRLILSNPVYYPPNSVFVLYCLVQFVAQQSLSLGQNTIRGELGNCLPRYLLFIYINTPPPPPRRRTTPRLASDPDRRREGQRLPVRTGSLFLSLLTRSSPIPLPGHGNVLLADPCALAAAASQLAAAVARASARRHVGRCCPWAAAGPLLRVPCFQPMPDPRPSPVERPARAGQATSRCGTPSCSSSRRVSLPRAERA